MNIALLMPVCEGEEAIGWDTLSGLVDAPAGMEMTLFVVDDASPSHTGQRLAQRFREAGHEADCHQMPSRMGFRGTAERLFSGLNRIVGSGRKFDLIVKLEADLCIARPDLLSFVRDATCPGGIGMYGEPHPMRARDATLILADCLPFGFARKRSGSVIERQWQLRRYYPVWWCDFGFKALLKRFRFEFLAGSFWVLGGKTLSKMADAGWLSRDRRKCGFTFTDDVLITIAAHASGDPVVDLRKISPHWGFLGTTEETALVSIVPHRPYVVHHLKDRPKAWERRRELKAAMAFAVSA